MTAAEKSYFDSKFETLNKKIDRVERGVYGDTDNNQLGLVHKDEDKQKRLVTVEKKIDRFVWTGIGLGMAAAGAVKLILSLI